jgi:hypothetical protein
VIGSFILARHMNDIELQNDQLVCPNPSVRCNVGAAVVTRNHNIQLRAEWTDRGNINKIKVGLEILTLKNETHLSPPEPGRLCVCEYVCV